MNLCNSVESGHKGGLRRIAGENGRIGHICHFCDHCTAPFVGYEITRFTPMPFYLIFPCFDYI